MKQGRSFKTKAFIIALVVVGGLLMAKLMMWQDISSDQGGAQLENSRQESQNSHGDFLNYDIVVGDKNSPIEIIEYAAISCPHCAHFHADIYPTLKKKYLDTGKAYLIYRNFIFDNPFDVFAASITRCVPETAFFPTLEIYFKSQKTWNKLANLRQIIETEGREAALKFAKSEVAKIAKTAGISSENSQKCFANEAVLNYLLKVRKVAMEKYDVSSTPTVIVGGKKLDGNDMATIEEAILAAEKGVQGKKIAESVVK